MYLDRVDEILYRLYKYLMKTLTITDAKKNLGRWLAAAAQGEDIGIISGADVIALRKVDVASLEKATDRRYRKLKASGKLVTVTAEELRRLLG